jgi:20S proteasome subunit alpha 4
MAYDSAITVFSPDGHLFQVEYAMEAVRKGTLAIAIRGSDVVCLGVEKKMVAKLQDPRTMRKIQLIDDHIAVAFAGLTADARVLINRARVEAQSHRLTLEDKASVEHMARYIGGVQQKYTQSGGVRPFGLATLICGFSQEGKAELWHTDPSGTYTAWKANAIGRSSKPVREWLEKNYEEKEGDECIELCIKALLEVCEPGSKHLEVAVVRRGVDGVETLDEAKVDEIIKKIEDEKSAAEEAKKKRAADAEEAARAAQS